MSGPADLLLVMRAFRGLIYYLERLDADVFWSGAIAKHIEAQHESLAHFDVSFLLIYRDQGKDRDSPGPSPLKYRRYHNQLCNE